MSSHVMAEVERVADRVGLIDEGRLALELSMNELRRKTAGELVFTFAASTSPEPFASLPGVTRATGEGHDVRVSLDGSAAAALRTAGELGATEVRTEHRDLDDVFVDLYRGGPSRTVPLPLCISGGSAPVFAQPWSGHWGWQPSSSPPPRSTRR